LSLTSCRRLPPPRQARAAWEVAGSTDPESDGPACVNGFAFEGTDPGALDYALNRAIDAYYNDRAWFRGLQAQVGAGGGMLLAQGSRVWLVGPALLGPSPPPTHPTLHLTPPSLFSHARSLPPKVMRLDWSWNRPALQYIDLYYAATRN
jgi:glycogen synthase